MIEVFPNPYITVTTPPCMLCGQRSEMSVDVNAYRYWSQGELLIQDAFPNLSVENRELLKTGTHPSCWDSMFSDTHDD
jgi:hypothetical protein